jgi:hypothetical protein
MPVTYSSELLALPTLPSVALATSSMPSASINTHVSHACADAWEWALLDGMAVAADDMAFEQVLYDLEWETLGLHLSFDRVAASRERRRLNARW